MRDLCFLSLCRFFQGSFGGQQTRFSRDVQEDLRYDLRTERVRLHRLFQGTGELLRERNGEYFPLLFPPLEFDYLDVKMAQLRFIFTENSVYKIGSRSIKTESVQSLLKGTRFWVEQSFPYYRKIWNYGIRNVELFIYLSFDVAREHASDENCNHALISPSSLLSSSLLLRRPSPWCIKRE